MELPATDPVLELMDIFHGWILRGLPHDNVRSDDIGDVSEDETRALLSVFFDEKWCVA